MEGAGIMVAIFKGGGVAGRKLKIKLVPGSDAAGKIQCVSSPSLRLPWLSSKVKWLL